MQDINKSIFGAKNLLAFFKEESKNNAQGMLNYFDAYSGRELNNTYLVTYDKQETKEAFLYAMESLYKNTITFRYAKEENASRSQATISGYNGAFVVCIDLDSEGNNAWMETLFSDKNTSPKISCVFFIQEEYLDSRWGGKRPDYVRGHMKLGRIQPTVITRWTLETLHEKYQYDYEEEYILNLDKYNQEVYARADRKGEEYVNDLCDRIRKQMSEQEGGIEPYKKGKKLTNEIPYYNKGESQESASIPKEEKENGIELDWERYNIEGDKIRESIETVESSLRKNTSSPKNILILTSSTFPQKMTANEFKYKEDLVWGVSQQEPVARMIARNTELDEIIILATNKSESREDNGCRNVEEKVVELPGGKKKKIDKETVCPVEFLIYQLQNPQESYPNIEGLGDFSNTRFVQITVDENEPAKYIKKLYDYLKRRCTNLGNTEDNSEDNNLNIFVDAGGGLRGVQRVVEAVISLMSREINGNISVYSVQMSGNPKPIVDETERFGIFRFVSGINEFLDSGKNDSLLSYFGDKGKEHMLVQAIGRVADGIQWNHIEEFANGLNELREYFQSKPETNQEAQDENEHYLAIFEDTIRDDFKDIIGADADVVDEIQWCMKKNFYQQALTLAEARIAYDLVKWGVLKVNSQDTSENRLWKSYTFEAEIRLNRNITRNITLTTQLVQLFNGLVHNYKSNNDPFREISIDGVKQEDIIGYYRRNERNPRPIISNPFDLGIPRDIFGDFIGLHQQVKDTRNLMNHLGDWETRNYDSIKTDLEKYVVTLKLIKNWISLDVAVTKFSTDEKNKLLNNLAKMVACILLQENAGNSEFNTVFEKVKRTWGGDVPTKNDFNSRDKGIKELLKMHYGNFFSINGESISFADGVRERLTEQLSLGER